MRKTWTWSTTGYGLTRKSHEEIIELCRMAELAGLEGAPPLFEGQTDEELKALGAQYRDAGVKIETFHLPFSGQDDLASFYETIRRQAVETARTWIERSALLGATVGIQHPTVNRCSTDVEGLEPYIRQLGKSLDELLPVAERLNYTIALENMLPGEEGGRLGSKPEHFEAFIQTFQHPNVGFCLDTGHALVAGGPAHADDFFTAMAPRMAAFHLADNPGDRDLHLAPGHGAVDWTTVFRNAARLEFSGCMCIETAPFAYGPNGTYNAAAWAQMVKDTEALATQALS